MTLIDHQPSGLLRHLSCEVSVTAGPPPPSGDAAVLAAMAMEFHPGRRDLKPPTPTGLLASIGRTYLLALYV